MSSLTQYIDLYRDHRELLCSHSAPAMNALRENALESLERRGLPAKGSENYKYTSLEYILAPNYGVNVARVPMAANPLESFKCDVPNLSTSLFFLVNDSFAQSSTACNSLPEGVLAGSLRQLALKNPEIVERYYGSVADPAHAITALDTLLAQDGFMLYVPKGVRIEKPIQLVSIFQSAMPLMGVRRILIVLEEDAEATVLVCDHTQNPDMDFLALQTVELIAGERSRLGYYEIEESSERTSRLATLYVSQKRDSHVTIDGVTLYNGVSRNEYYCYLREPHAELDLFGLGIEDRERAIDTYSLITHDAPDCHSNELFKYVAEDRSKGIFSGRILVQPGATGTEAYQANRNITGSDEALIYTKPQLEIYNDDVKCSHGTATGKLDESQIFYMRARGIDLEDAKRMLKQAFMSDVIDKVKVPLLRDRLQLLVEHRFSGAYAACRTCGAACMTPNSCNHEH